ncbi:MAG TPA: FliA/WhiG family RNA polymerase sigma factor [Desulfobaccales bacterium]
MNEPSIQDHGKPISAGGSRKSDSAWQEQMVLQYAPLIRYIASRLALRLPSHISQDDLISSGIIGLIDAIRKYDVSKNINFKTYAEFRIKGAMLDELRSLDWIPRSVRRKSHLIETTYGQLQKGLGRPPEAGEVAAAMGLELTDYYQLLDETKTLFLVNLEGYGGKGPGQPGTDRELSEILQDENLRDALQILHASELREVVLQAIEALPDKEKLLISLYYYEELTMKEIGQIMGYTESRISQMHTQAVFRLRHRLRIYAQEMEN